MRFLIAAQHRMNQTRAIALEGQRREQAGLSDGRGYGQIRPGWLCKTLGGLLFSLYFSLIDFNGLLGVVVFPCLQSFSPLID